MAKRKTGSKGEYRVVWKAPPNRFAEETFRTIRSGDHRVILACPMGEAHAGHCEVASKIEAALQQKVERSANPQP